MPYPHKSPMSHMAPMPQATPAQAELPMEMPEVCEREVAMRELFATRWCRWHRARSYEEAVADPVTARLLALAVRMGARHAPGGRR